MDQLFEDSAEEGIYKVPMQSFFRVTLDEYRSTLSSVANNLAEYQDVLSYVTYRRPQEPSAGRFTIKSHDDVRSLMAQIESTAAELSQQPCPLCGGNMVNIAPLLAFELVIGGAAFGTRVDLKGHSFVVPNDWECQNCHAYRVRGPAKKEKGWTREAPPASHSSFAARVFERLPQVSEVMPQRQGPLKSQPGWYLRVNGEWLFLNGPKDDVLFGLGIA